MTEQALQETLDRTSDFQDRQRLFKQLWKLRRKPDVSASPSKAVDKSGTSQPKHQAAQQVA